MSAGKPWKSKQISNVFPVGSQSSRGPGLLSDYPEIAKRFGQIISCWANTERRLVEIFSYLIDMEAWIAADMFEEVRGPKARFQILRSTLGKKFGKQVGEEIWTAILEPMRDIASDRDLIAHGEFIICSAYPNAAIRVEGWGKDEKCYLYDLEILDALFAEMQIRAERIVDLHYDVVLASPIRGEAGRILIAGHPRALDRRRNKRRSYDIGNAV